MVPTPVRVVMAKLAAAVRGTVAIAAAVAALLGAAAPVRMTWLLIAVGSLLAWTTVYVIVAWRYGLLDWLVGADLAFVSVLALAAGVLEAQTMLESGWGWVTGLVSMTAVCAQIAGRPRLWVPGGLILALCAAVGLRLAGVESPAVVNVGVTVATQALVSAAVMAVSTRTGRVADRAFADLEEAERSSQIASARRSEEMMQLRHLHNGPLTTLSMAIAGRTSVPEAVIRRRAALDVLLLPRLAELRNAEAVELRLDERLAQVVAGYAGRLRVAAHLPPCAAPAPVADAFTEAASEALENVGRHAGVDAARVELAVTGDRIEVSVADDGRGFTAQSTPGFGIREAMRGRMLSVGGDAVIRSSAGAGVTVVLAWTRP